MRDSKYKILLIEDDTVDQIAFKRYIQKENLPYDYMIAGSVAEAEKILHENSFEAIISDYMLGDGTAFEIFDLVKNVPVIFVTGVGNEQLAVKAIKAGAYDYLIKDQDRSYLDLLPLTLHNAIKHKRAEEELNFANEKIERLSWAIGKTDNAIMIANSKGIIEWVNEGFTRLTDYSPEDIIGTHAEVLRKGKSTGLTPGSTEFEKLHNTKTSVTYENLNYRKDGTAYWTLTTLTPALNENGEIERIIAIDSDITIRKQIEQELIEAKKMAETSLKKLEDSVKIKEQFLANMSHEIRTPMSGIIGLTGVLLKSNITDEQREYLTAIKNSGDTLLVVINDILDISKMEAGKMSLEEIPFKISKITTTIKDLFNSKASDKKIGFTVSLDNSIPEIIMGDPVRISQILMNLVSNAVKFTQEGEVSLSAALKEDLGDKIKIEFRVKDTGCGIPKDKIHSIFLDFTQVNTETTRKFGGTGLGLAITKRLAELHKGSIKVDSELGKGSTFIITIPFKKYDGAAKIKERNEPDKDLIDYNELKGMKILLVEDNPVNLMLAKKILTDFNCIVDSAENGRIAIEKLKSDKYDIVLMDIKMPEMDGYETTRYIRTGMTEELKNIPIIALTAHAATWEQEKCIKAGMNDFLTKPFNEKDLYRKILINAIYNGQHGREKEVDHQKQITPPTVLSHRQKYADLTELRKMSKGNEQFVINMTNTFIEEIVKDVKQMKKYAAEKNWDAVYGVAHKMKPSMQIMGVKELYEELQSIERFVKEKKSLETIPQAVSKIDGIIHTAIGELREEIHK